MTVIENISLLQRILSTIKADLEGIDSYKVFAIRGKLEILEGELGLFIQSYINAENGLIEVDEDVAKADMIRRDREETQQLNKLPAFLQGLSAMSGQEPIVVKDDSYVGPIDEKGDPIIIDEE